MCVEHPLSQTTLYSFCKQSQHGAWMYRPRASLGLGWLLIAARAVLAARPGTIVSSHGALDGLHLHRSKTTAARHGQDIVQDNGVHPAAVNASELLQQVRAAGVPKADFYVLVRGAQGINAATINGDYKASGTYNGMFIFQKEADSNCWLRYVTANGLNQWRISSTESVQKNDDRGYMYSLEQGLVNPAAAHQWFVWDQREGPGGPGSNWTLQGSVKVMDTIPIPGVLAQLPRQDIHQEQQLDTSTPIARHAEEGDAMVSGGEVVSSGLLTVNLFEFLLFVSLASIPLGLLLWIFCAWRIGKPFPLPLPGAALALRES